MKLRTMIEETCNSTLTVDSAQIWILKVDLNLKSLYGQDMDLLKYYDVSMVQVIVAGEVAVAYCGESVVLVIQDEKHTKEGAIVKVLQFRDPLIKLERGMDINDFWWIVDFDTACRKWYNQQNADIHEQYLAS